ncbi:lipid droplet-associated hydrolase [Osmerus eperlanus]|uniref:lipid droplet-associated hydrolase n=1 Tax=Osmerus eperlanus TaxID=29151 RepID=UPI002E10ED53
MECSALGARDETTEHLYCCGAVTEVLKIGTSFKQHSGSSLQAPPKLIFLIIPGNPGVVDFYKTFMQALHQKFGSRYPVWAVSHAGHCVPPDTMDMIEDPPVTSVNDVFGLNGQIEHKLAFLRENVPRATQLVLIGHSIGCYIILEMIKRDPELQVVKSVLLFPTIERMAQTPQGKVMTPVLCHLRYITYLPIFLLSLLPETLKAAIVKLIFGGLRSLDHTVIPATVSLFSVDCAANAMYMGGQEMRKVLARDNITINQNLNKLLFYYGASDHWCPMQYYHDMKRDFPDGDIKLCENGIRHAFVLDAGKEVASLIFEWIQSDVQT